MSVVAFDTLKLSQKLEAAGFSSSQAQNTAAALSETIGETVVTTEHLDMRLAELKTDILKWLFGLLLGQAAVIAALVKLL
ncbi:MAG: hypothetical protein A2516_04780 [Alphaproteobacteria bacterium RIFOXYD12_FULL_60_8]|nr:MAG: hypothetical protein A2516_04780 [Alphaproteobacteria bacterium RIFOXYD12_FULL_60_8]